MNRRVGKWINPKDGQEDWFEPATVDTIVLNNYHEYNFSFASVEVDKTILLIAVNTINQEVASIVLDELSVGEVITDAAYTDVEITTLDQFKIWRELVLSKFNK